MQLRTLFFIKMSILIELGTTTYNTFFVDELLYRKRLWPGLSRSEVINPPYHTSNHRKMALRAVYNFTKGATRPTVDGPLDHERKCLIIDRH